MNKKTRKHCNQRIYLGFGYDKRCGKKATHLLDKTEPVCRKCAEGCHPLRVSKIKMRELQ